jgi:hypothetical protein
MTATSLFHDVRSLYKSSLDGQISEHVNVHGLAGGDEVLNICVQNQSVQPRLHLTMNDRTFNSRTCILDRSKSPHGQSDDIVIQQYEMEYSSHRAGAIFISTTSSKKA